MIRRRLIYAARVCLAAPVAFAVETEAAGG